MKRLAPFILGWFFVAPYGSVTKLDFHTWQACKDARDDAVAGLGGPTAAAAKRLGLCREDVTPPIRLDLTGVVLDYTGTTDITQE